MNVTRIFLVLALSLGVVCGQAVFGQTLNGPTIPKALGVTVPPVKVMVGRKGMPLFRIAPPANFAVQPKTATFTINYLAAGEANDYGDVCIGWPDEAKAGFSYAANIWGSLLNSSVPIKISACWANMGTGGILGHGGASDYYRDFTGAPQADTFYPVATANALHGSDLNGNTEEIIIAYNAEFTDWYFGTDGLCPNSKIDFVQVVIHEMAHGLGFIGSMSVSGSLGSWGFSGYPTIYDTFTEDGAGQKLISAYGNPSSGLATALTSASVYFNGANANAGNDGSKVQLYAPTTWSSGSSYTHLAEIFNNTINAMMTYAINYGEAIHDPGPVTKGMFADAGWSSSTPSAVVPTIAANGVTNSLTVNYPDTVTITVAMNAGSYLGENVDWWVVAFSHSGSWYYLNSAMQLTSFNGDLGNCWPVYQEALFNLPSTTALDALQLPRGTYDFWFAVDYPMNGILNPAGLIVYDLVTVVVQ